MVVKGNPKSPKIVCENTWFNPLILGEAIPVPLENPAVIAEQQKYEKIINDEVVPTLEQEPYDRIPAECFTQNFDCEADSQNMCCAYIEK